MELGELDGITRRSDQEHLKSFLTERIDVYRSPYAKAEETHPRRCVFIGSANGSPLRDPTGSTRFAVIHTGDRALPLDWLREHRAEIWAQALAAYRTGYDWSHTDEELTEIAERNAGHTVVDPWHEELADRLHSMARMGLPVRTDELYTWLEVDLAHRTNQIAERVGRIMQGMGWVKAQRRHKGGAPSGVVASRGASTPSPSPINLIVVGHATAARSRPRICSGCWPLAGCQGNSGRKRSKRLHKAQPPLSKLKQGARMTPVNSTPHAIVPPCCSHRDGPWLFRAACHARTTNMRIR